MFGSRLHRQIGLLCQHIKRFKEGTDLSGSSKIASAAMPRLKARQHVVGAADGDALTGGRRMVLLR